MKRADKKQSSKREYAFQKALRCTAKSKRTGERCRAPAVRGYSVCRFHGARGGAPKGIDNGAWKHGLYGNAAKVERFLVKRLLEDALSFQKLFSKDKPDC
jgi:hypothetical protein